MNRTVVVAGAGGILCSLIAKHLAKLGDKVALLDINQEAVQKIASKIKQNGGFSAFSGV